MVAKKSFTSADNSCPFGSDFTRKTKHWEGAANVRDSPDNGAISSTGIVASKSKIRRRSSRRKLKKIKPSSPTLAEQKQKQSSNRLNKKRRKNMAGMINAQKIVKLGSSDAMDISPGIQESVLLKRPISTKIM